MLEHQPNLEIPKEPVLERQVIKDFIKIQEIRLEDFVLIEELSKFNKNIINECLHNLFNMARERSTGVLEQCISTTKDQKKKELYEKFLTFCQKYTWVECQSLVRSLERL